jgi:Transposase DDE domain
MHSTTHTQKNIGRFLKKSLKNNFIDPLPLPMAGNCTYTKEQILNTVLYAVSEDTYVEYAVDRLQTTLPGDVPSSDDVFYHLNKLDSTTVFSTFQQVNSTVLSQVQHQGIFKHPIWCGLDIHKNPYYGDTQDIHVLGMERVRGTNFGHGYASIECVNTRDRFTLAALPLTQFTTKQRMITSLLQEARIHAQISLLFLDREFFDVDSLNTLKDLSAWFVIPAEHNHTVKKIILSAHSQNQPLPGREECALITTYTMTKKKQSATVNLVIILYPPKKSGENWDEFAYITNIPVTLENALILAESYRKRWGIETGYRVKEEVRGKTCSPTYAIRLLFQMLSILLYNLWHLCNLILIIRLVWKKKGYPMILNKFRDTIADFIIGR